MKSESIDNTPMNAKPTSSQPRSRKAKPHPHSYQSVEMEAYRELLRQSQQLFNVHLIAMAITMCLAGAGCFLIFSGKPAEGSVSAVSGVTAGAYFSKLARLSNSESSKKLRELVKEVKALR